MERPGKDARLNLVLTEDEKTCLEAFARQCGTTVSEAVRRLIPWPEATEALCEYDFFQHPESGARKPLGTHPETIFRSLSEHLLHVMRTDPKHPIQEPPFWADWRQIYAYFTAWCKAKRGERDYKLHPIRKGKKTVYEVRRA